MELQNKSFQKFHFYLALLAILVFGITAYTSYGYYHGDEHFQIIEYSGVMKGTHTAEELAWEYKAQSRQTIQPIISYGLFETLEFLGVENNYYKAFILRLLTAFFAVFCIARFVNSTYSQLDKHFQKGYALVSYFLWFTPFIAVRFSSETLGGLFLILALSFLKFDSDKINKHLVWVGVIIGLSFLFRYQMVFAFVGLGLWLVFIKKYKVFSILKLTLGFVLAVLLGILMDSMFYGNFVLTIWEYFYKQLIEGMAAAFGTSPWHFYWQEIFRAPTYFIGLIFIVTIIVLFLSKEGRKQVELWIIIPFILGHNFVEHKEIRFLFPMIFLLPSIFFFAYDSIFKKISIPYSKVKYFHIGVLIVFLFANGIGIGLMASKSAGNGNITNAKYLHDITQKNEQKIDIYHLPWGSPFHPWENITDKFHTPQNLNDIKIDNLCSLDTVQLNKENLNFVILRKVDLDNNNICKLETENWKLEKVSTSIPEWMESIKEWYELEKSNESIFYLYQLHFKE